MTEALQPGLRTRAYIFNTLLHDKAVDDRLRSFPSWLSARNLANEASDESVAGAGLTRSRTATTSPRRWYALKAQLLGIDRLADYDRMASVAQDDVAVGWDEARDLVLEPMTSSRRRSATGARRFFDERWIDAPSRPGKRGGAFCAYTVPSLHPVRASQLHGQAPRRADAGARARPRRARRAGDAAQGVLQTTRR